MGWVVATPWLLDPLGKTWYPLYRRLCGPQGRSGRVKKILTPLGFYPCTFQPTECRYTDYTIPDGARIYKGHILSQKPNFIGSKW